MFIVVRSISRNLKVPFDLWYICSLIRNQVLSFAFEKQKSELRPPQIIFCGLLSSTSKNEGTRSGWSVPVLSLLVPCPNIKSLHTLISSSFIWNFPLFSSHSPVSTLWYSITHEENAYHDHKVSQRNRFAGYCPLLRDYDRNICS